MGAVGRYANLIAAVALTKESAFDALAEFDKKDEPD